MIWHKEDYTYFLCSTHADFLRALLATDEYIEKGRFWLQLSKSKRVNITVWSRGWVLSFVYNQEINTPDAWKLRFSCSLREVPKYDMK